VVQVPTWFAEGMAEYFSLRWDTRADMIIRDASISGYLPPIAYLDYYLAYQGGQSVFRYIAEKYGHEKISEILHKIKGSFRFDGAIKSALGIEMEELSDNWQKQMRKEYWPDIADRKEPKEISRALTDHKKMKNYLNLSPTLSPKGDKLVFLSDRDGRQSIYLMDVLEGKILDRLIRGESSVNFEELHWLSPGMTWSPDGKRVAFAAKAGDEDALYIYDLGAEDYQQFKFKLDGLFSAAWSPDGEAIAFIGNTNGASDIYFYNLGTQQLTNITGDVFSDSYPVWSNDGQKLAFVSDRGAYFTNNDLPESFQMSMHDYDQEDIYIVNRDGSDIRRITDTEFRESHPIFSPDNNSLFYVSDRSGIYNIYRQDLQNDSVYAVTNLLTGAFQLSLDREGKTLAFSSFNEGGWDIYTIKNPLELPPVPVAKTEYFKKLETNEETVKLIHPQRRIAPEDTAKTVVQTPKVVDYNHYVFADLERRSRVKNVDVKLKENDYKMDDGHYKVRNYKVKFTPDWVNGAAAYNTLWGFQGYTALAFSDVLGNHRISLGTNLVFDLRNSYLVGSYAYLAKRIDYMFTLYHFADTYYSSYSGLMRFRNYGFYGMASYPFSKFSRMDFSLNWMNVNLEYFQVDAPIQKANSVLPGIQLVHDTAEWGFGTGPVNGFRGAVTATGSPKYNKDSPEFFTMQTDIRQYWKLASWYTIATRLNAGTSSGADPQNFFLGGVPYWLNRNFNGSIRLDDYRDVFFSEFIMPLRGARYYERIGNNYVLTNFEFRFPLIVNLNLGFGQIPIGYQGSVFTDIGTAWKTKEQKQFQGIKNGRLNDIVAGYGFGARIFVLVFLVKYDLAWRYDLENSSKPYHYISLGVDF
jgi:Tol biopolymer transport system component